MSNVKRYTASEAYATLPYGTMVIREADYDALETECSRVTGENARLHDQIVELHLQCDQLRAERDSQQRVCISEMEKNLVLCAELSPIAFQSPQATTVYSALNEKARARTSAENVEDVLDKILRLIK